MEEYIWFAITLAAGFLPGLLMERTKVPMGGTMGAMLGVVVLNLATDRAHFIDVSRWIIMFLSGAMIGSTVGQEELRSMKRFTGAIMIVAAVMIAFNLGIGGLLYVLGGMDIATALFAATPGGATDMAIIAGDLGANTAYVAFMQVARGVLFLLIAPSLFTAVIGYMRRKEVKGLLISKREKLLQNGAARQETVRPGRHCCYNPEDFIQLAGLFLSAAIGGTIFHSMNIAGGMLIGSILSSIAYSVAFGKAVYPVELLPIQRILAGAYIGASVSRDTVRSLDMLLFPLLIMLVGVIFFSLLSGLVVSKLTGMDVTTGLLAASPCGVTELALLSEELGADTAVVSMVQVARFVIVVVTFPIILSGIVTIIG